MVNYNKNSCTVSSSYWIGSLSNYLIMNKQQSCNISYSSTRHSKLGNHLLMLMYYHKWLSNYERLLLVYSRLSQKPVTTRFISTPGSVFEFLRDPSTFEWRRRRIIVDYFCCWRSARRSGCLIYILLKVNKFGSLTAKLVCCQLFKCEKQVELN